MSESNHIKQSMHAFAKELASILNAGRVKHLYDDLILLIPSTMRGLLLQHLNNHVNPLVKKVIQKNLVHLSAQELKTFLGNQLKFTGLLH